MTAIDDVFEMLQDGEWHDFKDLAGNLQIGQQKLQRVIHFLENLGFIEVDKKQKRASINPDLKELMPLEH